MDAIVSGSARIALVLDDAGTRSIRLEAGEYTGAPISVGQIPFLLGDARDLAFLRDVDEDCVKRELTTAYLGVDVLHLTLMLCDRKAGEAAVAAAAADLESLVLREEVVERAERILYADVVSGDLDIALAAQRSTERGCSLVTSYLERLLDCQPAIRRVRRSWDALPSELFNSEEDRTMVYGLLAREGLCRSLVRIHRAGGNIEDWAAMALESGAVNELPGCERWLVEWMRVLREPEPRPGKASDGKSESAPTNLARVPPRPVRTSKTIDVLGIIEAAYDLEASDEEWLRQIARAAHPSIDGGFGLSAMRFENVDDPFRVVQRCHLPAALWEGYDSIFDEAAPLFLERASHRGPIVSSNDLTGRLELAEERFIAHLQGTGVNDSIWVTAADLAGPGCAFHAGRRETKGATSRELARWDRVAAHLSSALRLRARVKSDTREQASAVVFDSSGRLHDAGASAPEASAREELRQAVLNLEKARGAQRLEDPDRALGQWRALVAGRWSLVDQIESDGRRYIVARENEPLVPSSTQLTSRETQFLELARLGHNNKLIAEELGIAMSTVRVMLSRVASKLGVRSRAELVGASPVKRESTASAISSLSERERQVIGYAKLGHHDKLIAYELGISHSVVRVLLRRAASKLGARTRDELISLVTGDLPDFER